MGDNDGKKRGDTGLGVPISVRDRLEREYVEPSVEGIKTFGEAITFLMDFHQENN